MSEKRFSETEKHCYYTSLVFDNQTQEELGTNKVVVLLNEQQDQISKLQDLCGKSDYENAKLRKTINEVIKLLVEEVDLFSDKATEHDIIAYKEINQFDNKDAYYMCVSTKKAIKMLQRCLDE